MRIAVFAFVAALSVAASSSATSAPQDPAPAPVPIEEWSQAKVIEMGEEIQRQDVAAWVATDALIARFAGEPPKGLAGWIVVPEGDDQRVRFVRRDGEAIKAGWDVLVRGGVAGPVQNVEGDVLSPEELARYRARQTAIANIGRLRCSTGMNSVVAKDPDSDGWLVWLLAATTEANVVPLGGHYRFRISADGSTVLRRDMLSNGCLNMPRTPPGDGVGSVGLVVTQIVSQGPVETHVFLSLQNRVPIYVAADGNLYEVNGAQIRKVQQ